MLDTDYPWDSLAGYQWALDRGVDLLVVRVQMTGDGNYIVMNDATLTRTTNVREVFPDGASSRSPKDAAARMHIVADYSLEEIRKLRLLDPSGHDHPVPTLIEALDLIDGRVPVVLDLEGYEVESLAALLETRDKQNLLLFAEGDLPKLRAITAVTGIGAWCTIAFARDPLAALDRFIEHLGSDLKVVDVAHEQITADLIARAEQFGVRLSLRGADREDKALRIGDAAPWLEASGDPVAVFSTEYPDTVLKLLGR
jgi:hypothetical protein